MPEDRQMKIETQDRENLFIITPEQAISQTDIATLVETMKHVYQHF